jgi:ribosome biogenesis GTPase
MTAIALEQLGWDEAWAASLASLGPDLVPARVVLEHNHVYRVFTADGIRLAESAGRMKHRAEGRHQLPVVGDWVGVGDDPSGGRVQIREVLPRRSAFSRKAAGRGTDEQIIAANIDVVFIVFGLDKPVNTNSIDRYLVVARRSGAEPVVVLNKADLAENLADDEAEARAAAGATPVVVASTKDGMGVTALEPYLWRGRTAALIGPSGVGKSSIVNRLVGTDVLATGEVREWDARGRHTSVHRQLVVREAGGLIIDTPGMRELQLWDTDAVAETFDDLEAIAGGCRFRDCRHESEPGCAVKVAVDEGRLPAHRVESFLKLQAEQAAIERKRDERALLDRKRQGKAGAKAMRQFQKDRDRGSS